MCGTDVRNSLSKGRAAACGGSPRTCRTSSAWPTLPILIPQRRLRLPGLRPLRGIASPAGENNCQQDSQPEKPRAGQPPHGAGAAIAAPELRGRSLAPGGRLFAGARAPAPGGRDTELAAPGLRGAAGLWFPGRQLLDDAVADHHGPPSPKVQYRHARTGVSTLWLFHPGLSHLTQQHFDCATPR